MESKGHSFQTCLKDGRKPTTRRHRNSETARPEGRGPPRLAGPPGEGAVGALGANPHDCRSCHRLAGRRLFKTRASGITNNAIWSNVPEVINQFTLSRTHGTARSLSWPAGAEGTARPSALPWAPTRLALSKAQRGKLTPGLASSAPRAAPAPSLGSSTRRCASDAKDTTTLPRARPRPCTGGPALHTRCAATITPPRAQPRPSHAPAPQSRRSPTPGDTAIWTVAAESGTSGGNSFP